MGLRPSWDSQSELSCDIKLSYGAACDSAAALNSKGSHEIGRGATTAGSFWGTMRDAPALSAAFGKVSNGYKGA